MTAPAVSRRSLSRMTGLACVDLTDDVSCLTKPDRGGLDRINVRVDARLEQQLEASARGVSPSDVVRQAIEAHLKQHRPRESAVDLARHLGILGSAKGLPADLSTNPVHMDGFDCD